MKLLKTNSEDRWNVNSRSKNKQCHEGKCLVQAFKKGKLYVVLNDTLTCQIESDWKFDRDAGRGLRHGGLCFKKGSIVLFLDYVSGEHNDCFDVFAIKLLTSDGIRYFGGSLCDRHFEEIK